MKHAHSNELFNYWNRLRGGRQAPDRREVEPSDIRELLGDTFILEVNPSFKTISFRLAGTRLCNAHGRELKSVGFLNLWSEQDNLTIINTIRKVHDETVPCVISCISKSASGQIIEYEMVLLPLQNGQTDTRRILGISTPAQKENWIGSDPFIESQVSNIRFVDYIEAEETPSIETPVGMHDNQNFKRFGHLRVFDGGIS
jgi:hypothetical protein